MQGFCPPGVYIPPLGADPHLAVSWVTLGCVLYRYHLRIWGSMETESSCTGCGEIMEGVIGEVISELEVEECTGFGQAEEGDQAVP